jgi:hypothetical protein
MRHAHDMHALDMHGAGKLPPVCRSSFAHVRGACRGSSQLLRKYFSHSPLPHMRQIDEGVKVSKSYEATFMRFNGLLWPVNAGISTNKCTG